MSLFSPFTIIFWEWKAADAKTTLKSMSIDLHMSGRTFSMPLSYLFSQNAVPPELEKKHLLSGKKCLAKMALFFCILKNIRHWIFDFESAVCSQIFVLGIFYAKTFFPVAKVWTKRSFFLSFFLHLPTTITMTKTENRDFALIFQM